MSDQKQDYIPISPVITPDVFRAMRAGVENIFIDPDLQQYIVQLVTKTRQHKQIELGVSPRGSLALLKLSRAWAAINGRDYVLPDDIKTFAQLALSHRLIVDPNLWGSKNADTYLIEEIVQSVSVPVTKSLK